MKRSQEWWDRWFLGLARYVSTASKDPSTKVGVVLVDDRKIVVGMGYNGFPRGVEDTADRLTDRATKYHLVVHAEVNAVLQAGDRARGSTLYIYPAFPAPPICAECAKVAIQAGVACIVGYLPDASTRSARWGESIGVAGEMWVEADLGIRMYREAGD